MKLSEIFSQLTYGELSQLNIGGGDVGVINASNYDQILSHINLGLIALYKRFPLKESRLLIQLEAGRISYPLHSSYAVNNRRSRETSRFIIDTAMESFEDDILKVERVLTDLGVDLDLNNEANIYSCFTPSATVLRIPSALANSDINMPEWLFTDTLEIVYRANCIPIVKPVGLFDPTRVEVELPYSHLEPLLFYIASRINNPIGMTNEFHAGNSYAAKYEQSCVQLEQKNLQVDQGSQGNKFSNNGWA